jgi:hypothetical protein
VNLITRAIVSGVVALTAASVLGLATEAKASVIVTGYLANPAGTDSPYEYVQVVATENKTFSTTSPLIFTVANNGTATSAGWVAGGAITYSWVYTGSVTRGSVYYFGGNGALLNGSGTTALSSSSFPFLVSSNTGSTAGASVGGTTGTASSSGVVGNGGTNADGIAVFSGTVAASVSNGTVPFDAVFYGSGVGTAFVNPTSGYQLPVNDLYNGGKLQTNSTIFADPASGQYMTLGGRYNVSSKSFTTARSATGVTLGTTSTADTSVIASTTVLSSSLAITNSGTAGSYLPAFAAPVAGTTGVDVSGFVAGDVGKSALAVIAFNGTGLGSLTSANFPGNTLVNTYTSYASLLAAQPWVGLDSDVGAMSTYSSFAVLSTTVTSSRLALFTYSSSLPGSLSVGRIGVIPEPSSMVGLLAPAMALMARRRR